MHERTVPLTHYEFIRQVALAWLKPSKYWPNKNKDSTRSIASTSSFINQCSVASAVTSRLKLNTKKKNATFTNKSLDPYSGDLRCRLNNSLNHFPVKNDKPEGNCQLHYWLAKEKKKGTATEM